MPLDRAWIEDHIPHQGAMCLLDEVLAWDEARIQCRSTTHRTADNPLRGHGRLGAACGIEYAAQAMAIHGILLAPAPGLPPRGYLASVRAVDLHVARLDDIDADLLIGGERIMGDAHSALYAFRVLARERVLLSGRAAVVFDAAAFGGRPR